MRDTATITRLDNGYVVKADYYKKAEKVFLTLEDALQFLVKWFEPGRKTHISIVEFPEPTPEAAAYAEQLIKDGR